MSVRLIISQGPTRTRQLRLRAVETTIGRSAGCGLRIPSAEVSRKHCRLTYKDGFLTVEDLDSVNGTYLNGHRVTARHLVRPGDSLQVGPVTFTVKYELAEADANKLFPQVEPAEVELAAVEVEDDEPMALELASHENLDAPIPLDLEEGGLGALPEGNQLRDILSHLED
ncbi:MAG TPA: FHA domain-containing protein, partial [Gemmataceae bacterium]|nr:FHA domain-containing protein [Gemmataceae bacterium]